MIYLASRICFYVVFWVMEYKVDLSDFLSCGRRRHVRSVKCLSFLGLHI
jgi:hypothetical protein